MMRTKHSSSPGLFLFPFLGSTLPSPSASKVTTLRPVKIDQWGAGVVICLEQGADLHTAQLMPLPLTVSCFSKIQIGFTFLVLAYPGSPGKRAVKRACVCVCVCMRACVRACVLLAYLQMCFQMLLCCRQAAECDGDVACSGATCSVSAGLESIGLADVRLLVKLMCLLAIGRISAKSSSLTTVLPAAATASVIQDLVMSM